MKIFKIVTIVLSLLPLPTWAKTGGNGKTMSDKPAPAASRPPANKVNPIVIGKTRYELDEGSQGVFRAVDHESGKELWKIQLYKSSTVAVHGGGRPSINVEAMKKLNDTEIEVRDERKIIYLVDLDKKTAGIMRWPVSLSLVSKTPLKVKINITNALNQPLSFDKPSIAHDGSLSNDLFQVNADGKTVPYQGKMKKRVPPDSFLELEPQESFTVTVDLSDNYDVPQNAKKIEVNFEHRNHFSKDAFVMYSPVALSIE